MAKRPQERSRCSLCRERLTLGYKVGRRELCYPCYTVHTAKSPIAVTRLEGWVDSLPEGHPRSVLATKRIKSIRYKLENRTFKVKPPERPVHSTGVRLPVNNKPTQAELIEMFEDYSK